MRMYRNVGKNLIATAETTDESHGFYWSSHVLVIVRSETSKSSVKQEHFANCAEAFEWLVNEYGPWVRVRS